MKEKYVEERWPRWFSFGEAVANVRDLYVIQPTQEQADELIAEHNKLHDEFTAMALAWAESDPEAFTAWWYGRST